jgi:hypothetical protein
MYGEHGESTAHPFLVALQAYLVRAMPDPRWRGEDVLAVGVATPLEGQWLIATNDGGIIHARLTLDAPDAPRAALVVDAKAADAFLDGEPRGELHVLGDRDFLQRTLHGCLVSGSVVDLRSALTKTRGKEP